MTPPRNPNRRPLWSRVWRPDVDADVDDELRFHLDMRARDFERQGATPDAAAQAARDRFGEVERIGAELRDHDRRQARQHQRVEWMTDLWRDLSHAWRGLRRAPGFTAAALLTLALGIGATTAIFSIAYGVLLRPLPFAEPGRLVQLTISEPSSYLEDSYLSAPEYLELPEAVPALARLGAFADIHPTMEIGDGRPERLRAAAATASLFQTLGVRAALGRLYREEEDRPGVGRVVVLDHRLWQRRFGGDPEVVGRSVQLDGRATTVIGVLPADIHVGDMEAFLPLAIDPANPRPRGAHFLQIIARLAPDATLERARGELATFAQRSFAAYPESYADPSMSMSAVPLRDQWVGETRPMLLVLLGAVALLLLLACVNVASLLLVRAESRQREISLRIALGAGRGRLVRQLLTETALLALLGALVGIPLAVLGVRGLLVLDPAVVPAGSTIGVDGTVLAVAGAVVVLATLLAGLAPALQASRADMRSVIDMGSAGGGRRGGRLRAILVGIEFAVATMVLVGAGLVGRSFWELQQVDPGFTSEQVLTFDVQMERGRVAADSAVPGAYGRLLDGLRALPGVQSAAVVSHLPMSGNVADWVLEVDGEPARPGEAQISPNFAIASTDYLSTLSIPIRVGRGFSAADRPNSPPVVVLSASLARSLFTGLDPLGRRIRLSGSPDSPAPWMTVVGVAGDVRAEALGSAPRPTYYMLDRQSPQLFGAVARSMSVVVRGESESATLVTGVRRVVHDLEPGMAVARLRPLGDVVSTTVARPRFATVVLLAFGAAALLLAAVGAYGMLAYTVERRRREIGIRMALGAQLSQVRRSVVRPGLTLAAAGIAVGLVSALALTRLLDAMLYDVRSTDPASFAAAVLLLGGAALAASWIPARRATRVDPAEALRSDG